MADLSPIDIAQFWSRVTIKGVNDCWPWTGGTAGVEKYGVCKGARAHRISYTLVHGPICAHIVVRHTCDNTACCNPRHLVPGNQSDNVEDAVSRGRIRIGQKHGRAKLTEADVLEIRAKAGAVLQRDLAERFGVSGGVISSIVNRKTWRHI